VVHVAVGYPPAVGGISRQVALLGPRLRGSGFDVAVLTRSAGSGPGSETSQGISLHRVAARAEGPLGSVRFLAAGWLWLSRLDPRPSLMHAHELFSTATLALEAKRRWAVPAVLEPHSGGPHGNVARLMEKPFGRRRLAAAVATADRFIAITRQIHTELLEAGVAPERIVPLPNAVDAVAFAPADPGTANRRRRELRLGEQGPVVVYTGRLDEVKGIRGLLGAWPSVRARHPAATLVVVGDGPLLPLVEERAAGRVVAVGRVADVKPYLEAADVFVLPSSAEASSISLLEAMSMALPVVATAVGGTPELIADGVSGVLVAPDDCGALADGLRQVLAAPERRAFGVEARRAVLRSHRVEDRVERLADLYRQLLRPGQSG
jgi:glycosyltransferase involved in cell wall biosynthesis